MIVRTTPQDQQSFTIVRWELTRRRPRLHQSLFLIISQAVRADSWLLGGRQDRLAARHRGHLESTLGLESIRTLSAVTAADLCGSDVG